MLVLPSDATSDDHHYDGSGVRLDVGDDADDIGTGADGGSSLVSGLLAASAFEQGELLALGRTELATSEDRRRWEASRASSARRLAPPPGRGAKQLAALARAHTQLIVCGGCSALVCLQAARTAARRGDRDKLAPRNGCSACSVHRKRGATLKMQEGAARGVLEGRRVIVRRPRQREGGIVLRTLPPDLAAAHAHAALVLTYARVGGGGACGGGGGGSTRGDGARGDERPSGATAARDEQHEEQQRLGGESLAP